MQALALILVLGGAVVFAKINKAKTEPVVDETVVDETTETDEDAIRGKTYTCLMDLYREGEAVRAEIKELENDGDAE